jgi:hypothetical protein
MFLRREIRVQRPSRYPGRMDPADAPPSIWRRTLVPVLLVAAVAGLAAWLLFRDVDTDASVAGMRWAHTTQVQRWQDVVRSDWRQNLVFTAGVPPVRGAGEVAAVLVTTCAAKLHHEENYDCGAETFTHREEYACGTERKCAKVRRHSGKQRDRVVHECDEVPRKCTRDILEERPRVCTRPVQADWCDYLTQEWVPVRSEKIEGDAHLNLRFPELPVADDFERIEHSASYTLIFAYPGGQHAAVVPRREYDQWNPGDPVVLRTETVGGVLSFARPSAAPR